MVNKSIARKEWSRRVEDGKEIIINDYLEFEMDKGIYTSFMEIFEDVEYAGEHGVYYNEDDDISFIDVDMVIDELSDRMQEREEDEVMHEKILHAFLYPKYKGFKIWF